MPDTPRACSASLTASSWCGLMTAVTSFMFKPSISAAPSSHYRRRHGDRPGRADGQTRRGEAAARGWAEVVRALPVFGDVDAVPFGRPGHPEPDRRLHQHRDDQGNHERPRADQGGGAQLAPELEQAAAVEEALVPHVRATVGLHGGEEPDPEATDPATDKVHTEDVEGVVDVDQVFQAHRQEAE